MNTLSELKSAKPVRYNDVWFRVLIALVSAHFIITFNEKDSLLDLFKLKAYYMALGLNAIIAAVIIEYIAFVTRKHDRRFPWLRFPKKRLVLLVIEGILVPLGLSIALALIYWGIYGIGMGDTVYWSEYFPIIVLMVLLLNAYYFIRFVIANTKLMIQLSKRRQSSLSNQPSLSTQSNSPAADFDLLVGTHDSRLAFTLEGETIVWPGTLEDTIASLPAKDYVMVNRNVIISADMIEKVVPASSRRSLIILKDAFHKLNTPYNKEIQVSQRYNKAFIKWLLTYHPKLISK